MRAGRELDLSVAKIIFGLSDEEIATQFLPAYSKDWAAAFIVRDRVEAAPFSKRKYFPLAIQKAISERLEFKPGKTLPPEYVVLKMQPSDICVAAIVALST